MGTSNFYWQNAKNCYAIIAEDYYNKDGKILDAWNCGSKCVYGYLDMSNVTIN